MNTYAASFVPGGKLPTGASLVFANTTGTCSFSGQTPPGTTTPISATNCDNPVVRTTTSAVNGDGSTSTYGDWRAKTTTTWSGAATGADLHILEPAVENTDPAAVQALAINWQHPGATSTGGRTGLAAVTRDGLWNLVAAPTDSRQAPDSVLVQWRPEPNDDDNTNYGGVAADTAERPAITFLSPN
jgi:hypothetical protein